MNGTHSQVAPLCAELEHPETPVLIEVRDLILRVIICPKTIFHGQTRVPTKVVDNVLRVGFYNLVIRQRQTKGQIPHESTSRNRAKQH